MTDKILIKEYPDGSVTASNIRNNLGVSLVGNHSTITADKVTKWWDGSEMNDSKVDGQVYIKYKGQDYPEYKGFYFKINLPNEGMTFLEKNSVSSLKNSNNLELLLLEMKYFKGVKLNGYYIEGDTPEPIVYHLSTSSAQENLGNLIDVKHLKLVHHFRNEIDARYFGCMGDGLMDDTAYFQRLLDYCDQESLPWKIANQTITTYDTIGLNQRFIGRGQSFGPLGRWGNPSSANQPISRIQFMSAGKVAFLPKAELAGMLPGINDRAPLRINIEDIGISYQDFYYASVTNPTGSTCFKKFRFAGHSCIKNCQINTFNICFDNCSAGEACRIDNNTFREIGEYGFKQCVIGDSWIRENYFNGSVWAKNGAIAIDTTNMNMSYVVNNWFEFFRTCIHSSAGNSNLISGNIFDYSYRSITGFGFLSTITNNTFNHCSKGQMNLTLGKFKNLDPNSEMITEPWRCMDIGNVSRGLIITGNKGQAIEEFIRLYSTGSYRELNITNNDAFEDNGLLRIPLDKLINLVPPPSTSQSITNVICDVLMYTDHTELPTTNLFDGRIIILNGVTVRYSSVEKTWKDSHGEIPDYGNSNFIPVFNSSSWIKPNTDVSGIAYTSDGFGISFTATAANRFATYNTPFVQGDSYLTRINSIGSNSQTVNSNFEIRYLNASGQQLGGITTINQAGEKVIDPNTRADVADIATVQFRFGGGGSASTPVTHNISGLQVYKKLKGSYPLSVWYNGEKFRATSFIKEKTLDQFISGNWTFSTPITGRFKYNELANNVSTIDLSTNSTSFGVLNAGRTYNFINITNGANQQITLSNVSTSPVNITLPNGVRLISGSSLSIPANGFLRLYLSVINNVVEVKTEGYQ